ncbi:general transcription factor 3C polypeptide 6 [Clupea harengus]|uniref:General transcription factor 3C polypeptide 6 n=1 Tax=Clupea harengus TaxID=7950 RepID=A0A6P8GD33_CLUHA|nr:general transcription factor 3C polypeptide 6 [Clupea harengus]XP_031432960.1 general transcription factor 3C polypeptide 6 [Clupea harengus]
MEDEWEEEEQLVVAELSGIINSEFLTKCRGKCKIVDVDSDQPMMQVGRYVFAGQYEDALSTCVILEEQPQGDAENTSSLELKYKCHTMKKLMMQRTFLTERKEGEPSSGGIEILALSEGNPCNRNSSIICSFKQDPAAPTETDADALVASSDSDAEEMEGEQSSMADNPDSN